MAGVGIGGLVGTAMVPFFGTVAGAFVGAVGGVLCGLGSGLAIAVAVVRGAGVPTVRVVGALAAGAGALLEAVAFFRPTIGPGPFVLVCAVLTMTSAAIGAWLAPWAAFSGTSASRDRVLGRAMGILATAGATAGGLVGLVIGFHAYPPTAQFAAVEGAVFGGMIGVVFGFWAGLAQCLTRAVSVRRQRVS
jgi:hypothetical protein